MRMQMRMGKGMHTLLCASRWHAHFLPAFPLPKKKTPRETEFARSKLS